MKKCLVKVPFGPEITLYEGEFYGVTRHRIMLFFYFGLVCMILFTTMGSRRELAEPELVLGIAAIEVLAGIAVLLGWKAYSLWRARRMGRDARVHMGWALVATVVTAVSLAEVLDPYLLGAEPSKPLEFVLKLVFYLTVTELLTSVMMQYTMTYILADLRKSRLVAGTQSAAADIST